jgi:hypothetical protein
MCIVLSSSLWSDSISISANPPTLVISAPPAGQNPNSVSDSSTYYVLGLLFGSRRIVGRINANMPTGLTLQVQLQAPAGGTSAGPVTMTSIAQTLVSYNLGILLNSQLDITYILSATSQAASGSGSRTLTLTLQL